MHYTPIRTITQGEIDIFENDGVVCLRQFLIQKQLKFFVK
jgi:hypothetical protein